MLIDLDDLIVHVFVARSPRALRHRASVERRGRDSDPEPAPGRGRPVSGPVMLVVLDGFGLGDGGAGDATAQAHAPFFERARRLFPHAQLETSGVAVGLPPGQMGNSEVGHMTMGAGRIRHQDMTRISKAFEQERAGRRRRDRARTRRRRARQRSPAPARPRVRRRRAQPRAAPDRVDRGVRSGAV